MSVLQHSQLQGHSETPLAQWHWGHRGISQGALHPSAAQWEMEISLRTGNGTCSMVQTMPIHGFLNASPQGTLATSTRKN